MTRQNINIGSAANDGTGDTLRSAGTKINQNFQEIYTQLGGDSSTLSNKVTLVDSSSNIFVVDNQVSLSANEKEQVLSEPLIMMESEILKVQASSGNVDVIASVLEINREDR